MTENPIIWQPSGQRREQSAMFKFMQASGFDSWDELYRWSISDMDEFWRSLCEFCDVRFDNIPDQVLEQPGDMTTASWFPGGELNFAAHLLRYTGGRAALIFYGENAARCEISFDQLRQRVADTAAGLRNAGIVKGDRIAGFLPNCPEAIIAMLAASSIGAIWSSCSPDFGTNGVVDRFGQIEPRVLFCADGYFYNGKTLDCLQSVSEISAQIGSIEHTVIVPFTQNAVDASIVANGVMWDEFLVSGSQLHFESLPFDHPLYIMYSSGTTGAPKCIVHGAGGTLVQHLKEQMLHCDIGESDRLFYFTTCGWMMWNWLASGLSCGASLILFDGSPFFNNGRVLWEMAAAERITIFGTSARYLAAIEKAGVKPAEEFDLRALRTVLSTGSPLAPASFDYVYAEIGQDLQLSSIAGGTDIIACFIAGNPLLPVRRGELQCLALGMAVSIYDDAGNSLIAEHGELVCTNAFPSMPVGFWDDPGKQKYHAAYFEHYPGVWAQGDYAEITQMGGVVIYGRSDAVLNPGGVRIGTAEIYRQVESLDEVIESIAIGQDWDDDVRVVLFVVLREALLLDDILRDRIRKVIRKNTTPRHVPAKIIQVSEIPRTISGKIVELAVRSVVHGEEVKNTHALANPKALDNFKCLPELAE